MIDWLTILLALVIIITLVGVFGFLAWKMNMSDPLAGEDSHQSLDAVNEKKRKEKNTTDQGKKKRKDQKKTKRETKDEEHQQRRNKAQEPTLQTSEETDDEQEESEQELLTAPTQTAETSSKARKRNNKKKEATANDEFNRAAPALQSKVGSKDEHESTKQQSKAEAKSAQAANKQTVPIPVSTTTKKTTQPAPKQQQEQPFIVVGPNRQKNGAQQQNKSQVNATSATAAPVQQPPPLPVQPEQSASRQEQLPQPSSLPANPLPSKPQTSTVPPKVADLIKVLPSSQVVVTELMAGLDAFPLSTAELDIIMQKIANKQSVLKQDWNKLQLGQKVDPQAHIGQVLTESAKAYEDDVKTNSLKHVKDLTDELNNEKRRNNDLLKEKTEKDREIQILHAQLDSVQMKSDQSTQVHPQQAKVQTLESQLKRVTDENLRLNQQLLASNSGDSSNVPLQVLSEQIKKLSVDNANLEKKSNSNDLLAKEVQKEKEDLLRYNEQLIQSLQSAEKDIKHVEEKHHMQVDDNRTAQLNDINALKRRIEELERDNEQLRREEIVHVEPSTATDIQTLTVNNEEREEFEREITQLRQTIDSHQHKSAQDIEDYKTKLNDSHTQYQSKENELHNEIDRLRQEKSSEQQQNKESHTHELNALQTELINVKSTNEHLRTKQQQLLKQLLPADVQQQLPSDNQDYDQWVASYRQLFESKQRTAQEESTTLKQENAQLHKSMSDIENQLKDIEKTVQSKEETLLNELKNKDVTLEHVRGEKEQLNDELQRARREIQRLQSDHASSVSEARVLKLQLEEKFLAAAHSPAIVADESFELVKQPSPSLSPIVVDIRAGQLNDLMRSSREALANQESIVNQLDKHLGDRLPSGSEETSTSNQQS